jgi:hypothetical protein
MIAADFKTLLGKLLGLGAGLEKEVIHTLR